MGVLNLDYLKTFYQTYDKPLEEDFANLIDTLSTVFEIPTYNVPGTGDVATDVNNSTLIIHAQKQLNVIYHNGKTYFFDAPLGKYGLGAVQTVSSYYVDVISSQFTNSQVSAILELINSDVVVTDSVSVPIFEKGLSTLNSYSAVIEHSDVAVSSITLNGIPKAINASGTTYVAITESLTDSKIYTLEVSYIHNGIAKVHTSVLTSKAYAPQFIGYSAVMDYSGYISSNVLLTKHIQEGSNLEFEGIPSNQYIWFILSEGDINIFDQNSNRLRQGDWATNTFIISKVATMTLQDASIEPYYFYRSLTPLDTNGVEFKFKSE